MSPPEDRLWTAHRHHDEDEQRDDSDDGAPGEAKRMQKSSMRCDSSAKSTQLQTMALSLPPCSCTLVPGMTAGRQAGSKWRGDGGGRGRGREQSSWARP